MEKRGLLFIPDITGFSQFVTETEIEHSRLIIQELLEVLINSNELNLQISEIEGDAILFYKFGDPPQIEQLYQQVEKMFCAFHRSIIAYDMAKFCQCPACVTAINLSLKIITHFGEFASYNIKQYEKLIGKDVIVVHRLLKNEIEQHEYWMVTNSLMNDRPPGLKDWMVWNDGAKKIETGDVRFHYTQLSQLKDTISPGQPEHLELSKNVKVFSLSEEYDTDMITLFHATGDFSYWNKWKEGVKEVEKSTHFLPRVGMKCRSILEGGEVNTYASSYYYSPDRIEFSETEESEKFSIYYTLEKVSEDKTKLTMDYYIKRDFLGELKFRLTNRKKTERDLRLSMQNLHGLVKSISLVGLT
jgi:hypothetical protein